MVSAYLLSQLTRWKPIYQYLSRLWRCVIPIRALADMERGADDSLFPPEWDAQAYLAAINDIDILQLASSYNMGKKCEEFGKRTRGSFNFCVFVVFPEDDTKWVVRFPICPLLHEPWRKLQSEAATLEYLQANTTIRVPGVKAHGDGAGLHPKSQAKFPFIILEYISGRPLEYSEILRSPPGALRPLFAELGDALSQLRALEFQYGGALMKDGTNGYTITSPNSIGLNSLQLKGLRSHTPRYTSALEFAMCHFKTLRQQFSLPSEEMEEYIAQREVFALQDFELRLYQFIDPALNLQPFVLSHGDLRPPNIIVNEDLSLAGIIDWEWSGTVPVQFFRPPLWLGGVDATSPRDMKYRSGYSELYDSLVDANKHPNASQTLASEWGPHLSSSLHLFLPAALLRTALFIDIYYMAIFPEFYKDCKRDDKLKDLYESCSKFREMVREQMETVCI